MDTDSKTKKMKNLTKSEKLKHCSGCYNNDYNCGLGGAKECWCLDSMELIKRKKVHVDQVPPWIQRPQLYPNCYKQPRYVFIDCHDEDRQY